MSKPSALSPYLSLREAVRPAVLAYSIQLGEQERASELAAECDNLLQLTRELLKKAALVHLLSPEPGQQMPDGDAGDRQARLLDAYADAGMLWAKVVGSFMAIGGLLLEKQQWDESRHLAAFLENVGETEAANALSSIAGKALAEFTRQQITSFHGDMSLEEIREALKTLRELSADFPGRQYEITQGLGPICRSIVKLFPRETTYCRSFLDDTNYNLNGDIYLFHISSEFHILYGRS